MSISLKEQRLCSVSRSPIMSIFASGPVCLFLDYNGVLWMKKDDSANKIAKFFENPADVITAFDACAGGKNSTPLVVVGYESGAIEFLNLSATSQKKIKDAHKGSVVKVAFSPDGQTILSSSEDCSLKLWSKSGMLRSEIARAESPAYAVAWSPDSSQFIYGNEKNVIFKNIKPGVNDVTIKGTEVGIMTVLHWSSTENIILAAGEDCRFLLIDPAGQVLFKLASPQETPFVAGQWSCMSSAFILATFNELILGDKGGKIISRTPIKTPLLSLSLANDGNELLVGFENGEYQAAIITLYSNHFYKNYSISFQNDHQILISDIHSEYKEELEYPGNPITYFSVGFNKMIVLTGWKCHLYDTANFITPVIFQIPNDLILFAGVSPTHVYFAQMAGQTQISVYDFLGKQVSLLRLNCSLLNQKLFTLCAEISCYADFANSRTLQFIETATGKALEAFTHFNEITRVAFNNVSSTSDRKILYTDANKDLYLYVVGRNVSRKVASGVHSFMWHESLDIFVHNSSNKISIVYAPVSLYYDSKLASKVTKSEVGQHKYEFIEFNDFSLNSISERNVVVAHCVDNAAIKLIRMMQEQRASDLLLQNGLKLARFLKNPLVWGILCVLALEKKDTNTVELCLAQLECIDKVQYFSELNTSENKDFTQCKSLAFNGRFEECEKLYLSKKQFFNAVKMHLKTFEFKKAFEVARIAKSNSKTLDWLIDYVLWKRRRYLEEICQEAETEETFKSLAPVRSYDDIQQLRKTAKAI